MKQIISTLSIVLICLMLLSFTVSARDFSNEEILANELKELGLFYGVSETDFDLDRAPTRVEAVVMLIRVLGKESEAKEGTWKHPFTDVPEWANNYIGYAYSKGLANGQALTEFGVGQASSAMYITFVLRALGYSDTNGADFVWDKPFDLAKQIGILPDTVNLNEFWRSDVVIVSHAALSAHLKGTTQSLHQKLITSGVFTKEQYDNVYNSNGNIKHTQKELTSEEIYAKCSPAVFYIEIYDKTNKVISSGSGFFIDSLGTAVTNFHVIENAYSAKIQISDTKEIYDVIGVYDYSKKKDWAVIKVDCTNNKYLNTGDEATIVGASNVYTIGSPLGLQNTISQGLISNPERIVNSISYMQISAAISNGSSGGALLNKYGDVIGITSAGYDDGQNLNLAIRLDFLAEYNKSDLKQLDKFNSTTNKKEEIFNALKNVIIACHQTYDETMGYSFEKQASDNDTFTLYYNPDKDYITMKLVKPDPRYVLTYYFSIEKNSDLSATMYFRDSYLRQEAKGKAVINVSAFNQEYDFYFEEYQGWEKSIDTDIAKTLHNIGLIYLDWVLDILSNDFSVADIGYINYSEFVYN